MNIACYIPDSKVSALVHIALQDAGFGCEQLPVDMSLARLVRRRSYDLILIELGVKEPDREDIFSWMSCRYGESTPVMMLSSTRDAGLTASALNAGADDFISPPIEPIELIARVHAILRRTKRRPDRRIIELVGFAIDRESRTIRYRDTSIELTPREFTMAWMFFSTPGIYISRETIGSAIWGTNSDIAARTIEQHVYKLRKKLEMGPERGVMLRTAYNQGYRLELCGKDQDQII